MESEETLGKEKNDISSRKTQSLLLSGAFLGTITGASLLCGFGFTLAMAKKKDPSLFLKGITKSKELQESGGTLAMKALGWGTLYATTGFSLFCFTVWKSLGVKNLSEFREKVGSFLPRIPKIEPQGRSDFKSFRELMDYIIEESDKGKKT